MTAQRARGAERRRAPVRRVFLLTLGLNAAVAIAKAGYGYMSGSLTLGTDSLHSILDASSNVLALFGLRWAAAPADARHPYGRQKIEILAALGIGVLIVVGLFEFGAAAVHSLIDRHPAPRVGVGGFAIVLATMAINLWVARYERRKADELGSALLQRRRPPHPVRPLRVGRGGRVLRRRPRRPRLGGRRGDPAAGRADRPRGLGGVPRERPRSDRRRHAGPAQRRRPRRPARARRVVHRVRSRGVRGAVELDLHLEVAPDMSVVGSSRAGSSRSTMELKVKFPEVSDVIIHIEPKPQANAR